MKRFWLGLLLAIIIGAAYSWLYGPEWLEQWNSENQQMIDAQKLAGAKAGAETDQQGCLDQALKQISQCNSSEYKCTVSSGIFIKSCWAESAVSEGFCNDVPVYNEQATDEEKSWRKFHCLELGVNVKGCRLLLRQQQQLCSSQ